jgi:SulP family sulfate permease
MTTGAKPATPGLAITPMIFGRDLFAGAVSGLVTIAYSVSFSVLIFSGPLAGGVSFGLAALLTGGALTGLIVGLFTRLLPADAGPDTPAVAVMSVLAASIAVQFAGGDPAEAVRHTLLAISIATFLTGALLVALGALKAGIWLRFIPYPVIGGFLAASGSLLATGGMEVALNAASLLSELQTIGASGKIWHLAVSLGLAGLLFILRIKIRSFLLLPAVFFASIVLFDLFFLLTDGMPGSQNGWYLDSQQAGRLWLPLKAIATTDIRWHILLANGVEIAAVCGVTAIALLLDVSSLEVTHSKSADLDRELQVNGWGNLLAAPFGGAAGNVSMVGSLLIAEAGGVTRVATLAAAAVCGLAIFFSKWILGAIPTPLLGGVLIYLGVNILYRALIASAGQRSTTENILAVAITLAIVIFGYLIGIVLGILGACLSFAFSYSRINIIRQHLTRANSQSNVERSPDQMRLLQRHGEEIQILWLRGYIFFGTSNSLFEYVRSRLFAHQDNEPGFLLLDFTQVPGFDSSAVFSLTKLKNLCRDHSSQLVISGVTGAMLGYLEDAGILDDTDAAPVRVFGRRDKALQWCEDALLDQLGAGEADDAEFQHWLSQQLGRNIAAQRVLGHMTRLEIGPDESLVEQGSLSNSIDLIASGRVVISYDDGSGHRISLRHMSGQTVVGEMGFYRRTKRTASVIAEQPTIAYRMSRRAFNKLSQEDPEAAAAFHSFIVRLLSDRLEFANREIAALQEPEDER